MYDYDENIVMRDVQINNSEILEILNRAVDLWRSDPVFEESFIFADENTDKDYYVSDEYFQKIYEMGPKHNGFPERAYMASLREDFLRVKKKDPAYRQRYVDGFKAINNDLITTLGVKRNALAAVYPPEGYIGWHTNANASAYNLILTWSENGDGYWKHFNPKTKEFEIIQDKPGWQAKATYFGSYRDGMENVVYHSAKTKCWRMTVAYVFDREHKMFWQDALDELEFEV